MTPDRGPEYRQVVAAVLGGAEQKDVAARMKLPRQNVYNLVAAARRVGDLPPARASTVVPRSFSHLARRLGTRPGNPLDIVKGLDPDIMRWLIDQTPEGSSVMELIRSLVVDAYHDEQDRNGSSA